MELRKHHIKKENPTIHGSRLLGIMDRVKHINHKRNDASSRYCLNYEVEKTVRDVMLKAEFRKAQCMTSTRKSGVNA